MYDTPAELLRAIAGGEDSFLEFKELIVHGSRIEVVEEGRATSWLARQLCAFANTNGGVLALGVADDGRVVGVDVAAVDDVQQLVVNVGRDRCEPPLDHLLLIDAIVVPTPDDERTVVKVEILADPWSVHAPRGSRPTQRVGNTTREVSMEALPRLLERRGVLAPTDERPLVAARISDLDDDEIQGYYRSRFERDPEDLAKVRRSLKLSRLEDNGDEHPTVAGMLLFGRDPQSFISGAYVDLVAYEGTEPDTNRRLDTRRISGTVTEQIEGAIDYLSKSPQVPTASAKDGEGRSDAPAYSMRALSEAVVNAVAHRDYALTGAQIRVQIFSDRVEITSPGRLPNSLTEEDLYLGAQPVRRNQVLVGFLTQLKGARTGRVFMESMGEGFLTIVRESVVLGAPKPVLRNHTDAVTVTIFAAPIMAVPA